MECTKLQQLISAKPRTTVPLPSQNLNKQTQQSQTKPQPSLPPQAKQVSISALHTTHPDPPQTQSVSDTDDKINSALDNLTEFGASLNNPTTNETNSIYFTITTKSVLLQPTNNTSHITVVDSGAYPMMFQ